MFYIEYLVMIEINSWEWNTKDEIKTWRGITKNEKQENNKNIENKKLCNELW
jgi:hypothetical protein